MAGRQTREVQVSEDLRSETVLRGCSGSTLLSGCLLGGRTPRSVALPELRDGSSAGISSLSKAPLLVRAKPAFFGLSLLVQSVGFCGTGVTIRRATSIHSTRASRTRGWWGWTGPTGSATPVSKGTSRGRGRVSEGPRTSLMPSPPFCSRSAAGPENPITRGSPLPSLPPGLHLLGGQPILPAHCPHREPEAPPSHPP